MLSIPRRRLLQGGLAAACSALVTPSQAATGTAPLTAYLLAYFTDESMPDGEQIYFSTSRDALHWTDLHAGQPMLVSNLGESGVRDPALVRAPSGDRFYLLATDLRIANGKGWDTALHRGSTAIIVWESGNLIEWSAPRRIDIAANIPGAGCMWAPEAIFDDLPGDYFVYWTTVTMESGQKRGRIYYARTRDFRTFTPAKLYIRRPDDAFMLDTQIVKTSHADPALRYVRVSGDGIFEASDALLGAWRRIGDLAHTGKAGQLEGPILFPFNQSGQWGLWMDQYKEKKGYLPLVADDVTRPPTFQALAADHYDLGRVKKRHGSVLGITEREFVALQAWQPSA
jgi:hypothetical protein